MQQANTASILAIGNELLLGQVVNKNAADISKLLLDYNIACSTHLVVADIEAEIHAALVYLEANSNIIFVSGGLGPTEDDLTRHALAKHLNLELDFVDAAYADLVEKLSSRSVKVTENHKRQAMFPRGATRIQNDMGTAEGFYLSKDDKHYFALPGPPLEIAACWKSFIATKLEKDLSNQSAKKILSIHILGLPESEVADRVDQIVTNYKYRPEYRLHLPYVEIRFQHAGDMDTEEVIAEFKQEFGKFLFYINEEGLDFHFKQKLEHMTIAIIDEYSGGYLQERLAKDHIKIDIFTKTLASAKIELSGYDYLVHFKPASGEVPLLLVVNDKPILLQRLSERRLRPSLEKRKIVELALWKLVKEI